MRLRASSWVPHRIPAALIVCLVLGGLPGSIATAGADDRPGPSARAAAKDSDWTFEADARAHYLEGSFGTGHTTQIVYAPFSLQWSPTEQLDLRATLPFVRQRGRTIFASVGGDIPGGAQRVDVRRREPRQRAVTVEGLGDAVVDVEYALVAEREGLPEIAPFLEVKLPTADSARGLGTGAFDEALGASLIKALGGGFTALLELSYTFVGSPAHARLENFFAWSAGAAYDTKRSFIVAAFLEGATRTEPGDQNPLEVRVEAEYKITRSFSAVAGTTVGLSRSVADFGFSTGLRFRF